MNKTVSRNLNFRWRRGFTIIELLVVTAIIALLIGILLPALAMVRLSAQKLLGQANHRGVMQGVHLYADQYDDNMPAGHDTAASNWAYTWPAMIRDGLGNDAKSMEIFLNPGAGKDYPVEWYMLVDKRGRAAAVDGNQTRWGYEAGEIMIKQSTGGVTSNILRNGFVAFSMGWNETGTGYIFASSPRDRLANLMLGAGMHVSNDFNSHNLNSRVRAISEFGPKRHSVASPANFIVVCDSFVNADGDPWVSPLMRFSRQNVGGYFGGQGNFSFHDGHVESLPVRDYNISDETLMNMQEPATRARIRRWNNDNKAHTGTWATGGE